MEICLPETLTGYDCLTIECLLRRVLQAINWDLVLKCDRPALDEIEVDIENGRSSSALRRLAAYLSTHLIEPEYGFSADTMARVDDLNRFLLGGPGPIGGDPSLQTRFRTVCQIA